tara:strand:- start:844 stop:1149 length:306 start_codon:yes stop_codon:yes gene_type:complete
MEKLTKLELELLIYIMQGENDGIGMGYSEYSGEGISNEEKGVLGSLMKKGFVYDSYEEYTEEVDGVTGQMYCTTQKAFLALLDYGKFTFAEGMKLEYRTHY